MRGRGSADQQKSEQRCVCVSNSGRNAVKRKPTNPKPACKKEGKTAFAAEEINDASNQTKLASGSDASTSDAPGSQPTLANILAAIGKLDEDMNTTFQHTGLKTTRSKLPWPTMQHALLT